MSIKSYFLTLMRDEKTGISSRALKFLLKLASGVYSAGIRIIDWAYKKGVRKVKKMPVPVISVGNLTLGGTGKTPFTVFLADHLLASGRRPAVLIRGYGNDEFRMLKDELADVPVFVGRNRAKNAVKAVNAGLDTLILDDGFQHRTIDRDLNILLMDAPVPLGNGHLFPRGILREPVSSIERADMIVLTKADRVTEAEKRYLVNMLSDLARGKPVIVASHKPVFLTDVTGAAYDLGEIKGSRVCIASGIADPAYFSFTIKKLGAKVAEAITFDDHHDYSQNDIDLIRARCMAGGIEKIIVTDKDYVKIQNLDLSRIEDKLFILRVRIEITEQKERFLAGLNNVIHG